MSDKALLLPELQRIAEQAGKIAQAARANGKSELKPDGSIVTNGDREVETYLRKALPDLAPGAAFWGEEFGFEEENEHGVWLVDPIDGTSNYAYGSPIWGVSIALAKGESVELGAIYLPDIGEMYLGAPGQGVTCNGQKLKPIPAGTIEKHQLISYGDSAAKSGIKMPGKMRCSGCFVIDGVFTLQQRFRGMIGIREKLYDVAAVVLFGRELNADIRYADGKPFEIQALKDNSKIEKPWFVFPQDSGFFFSEQI